MSTQIRRPAVPSVYLAMILAGFASVAATAQGAARQGAARDAHLMAPEALSKLLPAPEGWPMGAVTTNQVDMGTCTYSFASATYTRNDMRVKITLADTGAHADSQMALVSMVPTLPEGHTGKVPPATTIARVTIAGQPAAEMWTEDQLKGEISLLARGRFAVMVEAPKVDSLDTLRALLNTIDLKTLAAK